jgi:hypothetical protein
MTTIALLQSPAREMAKKTIEIGRKHYYGGAQRRWIDWSDMPYHGSAHVLWPLEAILGATTARRSGSLEVRGDACARYLCDVLPGKVARTDGIELVAPPEPDDDWRALSADVCIDGSACPHRSRIGSMSADHRHSHQGPAERDEDNQPHPQESATTP